MRWMLECAWRAAERGTWELNVKILLKKGVSILAQKDSDRKRPIFLPMSEYREKCRGRTKGSWWSGLRGLNSSL